MKEKFFKVLFPGKAVEMEDLHRIVDQKNKKDFQTLWDKKRPSMNDLMRESIGMPYIDFAAADTETGLPPHYLSGLDEQERRNRIVRMETIYKDPDFQEVCNYVINLIGNHSIQVAPEDKMKNGRMAIIGVRHIMSEFKNAHDEFIAGNKGVEKFNEFDHVPE